MVPSAHRFAAPAATSRGARVHAAFARDARADLLDARRFFARHGARVVEAGPEDSPAALLGRVRGPGRRVA